MSTDGAYYIGIISLLSIVQSFSRGNIIGEAVLVGIVYWMIYLSDSKAAQPVEQKRSEQKRVQAR